jgi:hypothetical protein
MVAKATATTSEISTDERAGLLHLHSCRHGVRKYMHVHATMRMKQSLVIRELAYDLEARRTSRLDLKFNPSK